MTRPHTDSRTQAKIVGPVRTAAARPSSRRRDPPRFEQRADRDDPALATEVRALGLLLGMLVREADGGSPRLRADLDSIVRVARHAEPAQRYATAERLCEFEDLPETAGRVRLSLGALDADVGRIDDARRHFERGLELARAHRGFDAKTIRVAGERQETLNRDR